MEFFKKSFKTSQHTLRGEYKLISMNRNTSPISPFTKEDYDLAYQLTAENQYPEIESNRFKENYARLNKGFSVEQMELANGADEWIQKLMITYGQGGVLILNPDFFMYEEYARQFNCPMDWVEANEDFSFDVEDIVQKIEEVQPKLFILSNPHNPTGKQFSHEDLQIFADAMEAVEGYLTIDEAYIEFGQEYVRPKGDHVILIRTMSKIYGMAGLRIGIVQATGETYSRLLKINHPYPINALTLNLANAFLENEEKVHTFLNYQLESKQQLEKAFSTVTDQMRVLPTQANFVFTAGEQAISLGHYLQENGFQGRFYKDQEVDNAVRYSILKLEEYALLETILTDWRNRQRIKG